LDIAVIGAGHVGLVSAACLAAVGHPTRVLDIDETRIEQLRSGRSPFLEPGLDELLVWGLTHEQLSFHTDPSAALSQADLVFLCVDTPNDARGSVDLSAVVSATRTAVRHVKDGAVVVNRSTAPVGTAEYIRSILEEQRGDVVDVAVNPEFLAEGTAVRDFLAPDRIVVGVWHGGTADSLYAVYEPIITRRLPSMAGDDVHQRVAGGTELVPFLVSNPSTAELTKYAANAFLAVKISFINEIASIAEELGGDVTVIAHAVGLDRRIGPHFLRAGIGWGGSCFPKDILALQGMAETRGLAARMLRAANEVNAQQRHWVVQMLQRHLKTLVGRRVGLLGLTFKPNTDDLRNAPALEIAAELSHLNARIQAFDPVVKSLPPPFDQMIEVTEDAVAAARGAEALIVVTEWPEFGQLDLAALRSVMRGSLLVDGRNFVDPESARDAGFDYLGVGRVGTPAFSVKIREGATGSGGE